MSNYIYRMFGASPIQPLQEHMGKVHACVSELIPFFEAAIAGNIEGMEESRADIVRLENEADTMKKKLRLNLPKGMFLPVSRRDLLDLITMQDRIANTAKDISGLMLGRQMSFPEEMGPYFLAFLKRSIDASAQARKAINEFDELLETGFRGAEVNVVKKLIKTLNQIEGDTDELQIKIRAMLFEIEENLPPVEVMFLYNIIEKVGDLGDLAQRVGSRLQLMLAK